jgi:hypothetical protein
MDLVEAAGWGLAGGASAGLISISTSVVAAGFRWPWQRRSKGAIWPYLFVAGVGIVVGAVVAAAAHSQITGEWPALIMGASAPSVVRGIVGRIEVAESKAELGQALSDET